MAPHSGTFAWKVPWMEEPGGLHSMGLLWIGHDRVTSLSLFTFHALQKEMATHSSILAWRIPGTEEPSGLPSMGSHRVRHDWSDLAASRLKWIGVCKCTMTMLGSCQALSKCSVQFSSVQSLSCLTICDPMDYSMPGFPVRHQLPEFAQTHVHWVSDAI